MTDYSLQTQIHEVERELAMRREVYPRRVATQNMRQAEAEMKIAIMESVLKTLKELKGEPGR